MSDLSLAKSAENVLGYKPKERIVSGALSNYFTLPQSSNIRPPERVSAIAESHAVDTGVGQSGLTPIGAPTISYADTGAGKPLL